MKNSITLEKYNNHFYPIQDDSFEDLRYFIEFLSTDYRQYDQSLLQKSLSFYNSSFVYHNLADKILYIGFSEWEIRTEVPVPCDNTFSAFVNSSNSCKINTDNFIKFTKKWIELKESGAPFALMYRNDNDWVDCESFQSKEEMEEFVKNHKSEH